ncbi:MAG: CopG family transcriptional regulator [Verrucomicrobiota bacterium]
MPATKNMGGTTVQLDGELHKALKIKAAETSSDVSNLVNEAVRDSLREDLEDLETFKARCKEPTISFEDMLKKLNLDGKI